MTRALFPQTKAFIVIALLLGLGLAFAQPVGAKVVPIDPPMPNEYSFVGVPIEWVWIVRADDTLGHGHFPDAGVLQIEAECPETGSCTGVIDFTGALGTATCSNVDGTMSGYMELYLGPSFDCAAMDLQLSGFGACEVKVTLRAEEVGTRQLVAIGPGVGVCT